MDNNSCLIYMLLHQILLFCKFLKVTKKDFKTLPNQLKKWRFCVRVSANEKATGHCSNKGSLASLIKNNLKHFFCSQCYSCLTVCSINMHCITVSAVSLCRSFSSPLGPLSASRSTRAATDGSEASSHPFCAEPGSAHRWVGCLLWPLPCCSLLCSSLIVGMKMAEHLLSMSLQSSSSWVSEPHLFLLSTNRPKPSFTYSIWSLCRASPCLPCPQNSWSIARVRVLFPHPFCNHSQSFSTGSYLPASWIYSVFTYFNYVCSFILSHFFWSTY